VTSSGSEVVLVSVVVVEDELVVVVELPPQEARLSIIAEARSREMSFLFIVYLLSNISSGMADRWTIHETNFVKSKLAQTTVADILS
jgi:hypothetical protein